MLVGLAAVMLFSFLEAAPPARAPGPGIDSLVIQRDPTQNGTWVANGTYMIGDNDTFWAVGYNTTLGYLGPVAAYWWSDNTNSGTVSPYYNVTSTEFSAGPQPGTVHVWAHCGLDPGGGGCWGQGTRGVYNATGPLTVLQAPIASIEIRDAPNGGGNVVGNRTYYQYDTDVFYAAGYDANGSYAGEVPADWSVNDTATCDVTAHGASTTFSATDAGVCVATATYGTLSNATGDLTVLARPTVYVDDDGVCGGNTPCFPTFTAALASATDGYYVVAYAGNYSEHVVVDKEVRIRGLDRDHTIVDGGGDGTVFNVTANSVEISNLTIQEGKFDVLIDHANDTYLVHNLIRNYSYGIYFNRTNGAFTAWNLVTTGQYGVVTDHVNNDAVRWNTIAYNTVYGAKDYDSTLRNCFNWNRFHDNAIAYYYDPTDPLQPFEFDGNELWDNGIGMLVVNGPALRLTNNVFTNNGRALVIEGSDLNVSANTFVGNFVAVEVVGAAGNVTANTFRDNTVAVSCTDAATMIAGNTVTGGAIAVACSGFSGTLAGNDLLPDGPVAVRLEGARDASLTANDVHGRRFDLVGSAIRDLALVDTDAQATDTTIATLSLDATSRLMEAWSVEIRTVASDGTPVAGAGVTARDQAGKAVAAGTTDADGRLVLVLPGRLRTAALDAPFGPYTIHAAAGAASGDAGVTVEGPARVTVTLEAPAVASGAPFPWLLAFGSVIALSLGGGLLALEPVQVALLALLLPLFTRIGRDDVLDDYTRGRVYQYLAMNPGDHFNSICRALDLGSGTVTYHLSVLERAGLVSSRTDRVYKRFYPKGFSPPETNGGSLSEVQVRIAHAVRDLPGITQKELARLMGVRASTVSYQIDRLAEQGLVRAERRGRHVRYFPGEGPKDA